MGRDVQLALDEAGRLAGRIYPPLLGTGGLAAALRAAAASTENRTTVEVAARESYAPEILATVFFCCLEVLERGDAAARTTIIVRDEDGALAFELRAAGGGAAVELDGLRDRVEALGGRLRIASEAGGTSVSGVLPVAR
jgi:signal transduction histidine kinase